MSDYWDFKSKTDDELVKEPAAAKQTLANTEMLRRLKGTLYELKEGLAGVKDGLLDLKVTLHAEEVAIKRLTRWLVGLTWVLVVFTVIITGLTIVLVVRHG